MTKHTKFKKSLHLNTETVRALGDGELKGAAGAGSYPTAACWSLPNCRTMYIGCTSVICF